MSIDQTDSRRSESESRDRLLTSSQIELRQTREFATAGVPDVVDVVDPQVLVNTSVGNWKLRELLGQGSMGAVYRGFSPMLGEAAVKVLLPALRDFEEYLPRFRREAEISEQLAHPSIVQFREFSETPVPHLALQFVEGTDLQQLLNERRKLRLSEALPIMHDILEALDYAHHKEIIHRDLKPQNILINLEGHIFLADFGIGRKGSQIGAPRLTQTGTFMGTPHYAAPEQIQSFKNVGNSADLYSIGVMFFHMLAGQPPFLGGQSDILNAHIEREAPDVRSWAPSTPREIAELIQQLMNKKPNQRPGSAREVLQVLDRLIQDRGRETSSHRGKRVNIGVGERVGRWVLDSEIGVGGMGKVFSAHLDDQEAAVKILLSSLARDETAKRRFQREVTLLQEFEHPNVIRLIESGHVERGTQVYPFIVVEKAKIDLENYVEQNGPLTTEQGIDVAIAMASVLHSAHARGIVHRDVKPPNILLVGDDVVTENIRLTDFGVAHLKSSQSRLTVTNAAIGSPHYMAPEQARKGKVDFRADLYSLGATLYFLLTGSRLFATEEVEALVLAHAQQLPEPVELRNPNVTRELALIINCLLIKDPELRYPNAETLIQDLQKLKAQAFSTARIRELQGQLRVGKKPFEQKTQRLLVLSIVLAIVFALIALFAIFANGNDPFADFRVRLGALKNSAVQNNDDWLDQASKNITLFSQLNYEADSREREGQSVPTDISSALAELKTKISSKTLASCEQEVIQLRTGSLDKQTQERVAELLRFIDGKLMKRLDLTSMQQEQVKRISSQLDCLKAVTDFNDQLDSVREIYESGDYESAQPRIAKLVTEQNELIGNFGRRNEIIQFVFQQIVDELSALSESCAKKLKALQDQVTAYEQLCAKAVKNKDSQALKKVQAEINEKFLSSIPEGNDQVKKLVSNLLILRIDFQEDQGQKAYEQIVAQRTSSPDEYAQLLAVIKAAQTEFPALDYPKLNDQLRALKKDIETQRDGKANEQFHDLVRNQQELLRDSELTQAKLTQMIQVTETFASRGPLQGWSQRDEKVSNHVTQLHKIEMAYPLELLGRAQTELYKRQGSTGSKAFLQVLNQVEKLVRRAQQFKNYQETEGASLLKHIELFRRAHNNAYTVQMSAGTVTIGQSSPGLPFNPEHQVKLSGFVADKYEVKVADFAQFLEFVQSLKGDRPDWCAAALDSYEPQKWTEQLSSPDLPVRGLTFYAATAYATFVGKRLPTEFEWEALARQGVDKRDPFPWGNLEPDKSRAWFRFADSVTGPIAVNKQLAVTKSGTLHLIGNVAEWTSSYMVPYPKATKIDMVGCDRSHRVVRGGSYASEDLELDSWRRDAKAEKSKDMTVGFRCVSAP